MLDKLKDLFSGEPKDEGLYVYARCNRCGAVLHTRLDVKREAAPNFEEGGYILRKEMMDSKCFELMHAEFRFDDNRNLIEKSIDGGEFITRQEWESQRADTA